MWPFDDRKITKRQLKRDTGMIAHYNRTAEEFGFQGKHNKRKLKKTKQEKK